MNKTPDIKLTSLLILLVLVMCFACENETKSKTVKRKKYKNQKLSDSLRALQSYNCINNFIINSTNPKDVRVAIDLLHEFFKTRAVVSTFRGNESRNYYGNLAPNMLKVKWKLQLGSGKSNVGSLEHYWTGAGWTGQPLIVTDTFKTYIFQGAFDYHLRKIDAADGSVVWKYKFDDILKGTPSIWTNPDTTTTRELTYLIMQGSRRGEGTFDDNGSASFRAISYENGKEVWRFYSKNTNSYSTDVDASALVHNGFAYIGLENSIFAQFNPSPAHVKEYKGYYIPDIVKDTLLYLQSDINRQGGNLVIEASPVLLGNRIYIASGAGHIFGYNLETEMVDWDFFTGSDIDGTPVATFDSCLIVTIEKQYISGHGGTFKLNPSKSPDDCVVWYSPTGNRKFASWEGGIIGTAAVNDKYVESDDVHLCAFTGIDGYLYVVNHTLLSENRTSGPHMNKSYAMPTIIFKEFIGSSISSPIIVGNKLIAASYKGLYLFEFNDEFQFKLLDFYKDSFEASPACYDGRVYIASNTSGFMYCFGE